MFRAISAISAILIFLTFGRFKLWKITKMPEGRERDMAVLHAVQKVLSKIIKRCKIELIIEGEENIPSDEAVLIVANHRSIFDVIIGYTLVKEPTGFIAKKEIEKHKSIKIWMDHLYCFFMDRDNLKQSLKVIIGAIKQLKNGKSVWIYPEGTRSLSKDACDMLPFKEGSFKIALKSEARVLPIAMLGTENVLKGFPFIKPRKVYVKVGKPFSLCDLKEDEKPGEYTRDMIKGFLEELKEK